MINLETNIFPVISQISHYSTALLAISLFLICFPGYHYFSSFLRKKLNNRDNTETLYTSVIMQRITGFIFYGFIPVSIFYYIQSIGIQDYGINLFSPQRSLIWVGIFAPLIVLVNYFFSGKESNLRHYPQIRLKIWNSKDLMINFSTWLIYLFAYEAFFRGLLFFAIFHTLGVIAAIAINVLFYALAHLPKGRKETFASIPFGIVLCLITLDTGSFLAAFIIHGIMAISYEFFSIKAHPEMSITNKWI